MKKVKLTREQADVIEKVKCNSDDKVDTFLEYHLAHRHSYKDAFTPLLDLTVDEIAIALHVDYEVEETFDVGDWVVSECGLIGQFYEKYNTTYHFIDGGGVKHFSDNLRHATPEEIAEEKERRWWARHGREPWELKKRDILKARDGGYLMEVKIVYPGELVMFFGGVATVDLNQVKEECVVACFSHDRKDVDNA